MLTRMQTIDTNDLVSGLFEACSVFEATGDGSPVCAGCGWLVADHSGDHVAAVAEVRALPARPRTRRPKRLAS